MLKTEMIEYRLMMIAWTQARDQLNSRIRRIDGIVNLD